MTRRELIGMASVGAVAIAIGGGYALTSTAPEAPDGGFPVQHSAAEWRALLSQASYRVLREGATEMPNSSPLLSEHREGIFICAGCGKRLFESRTKFESHTGWPSFWDVIREATRRHEDRSLGVTRTEVGCAGCGGHLGHVFNDGPKPTGLRYCMNGVAMGFEPIGA